jgi:hypothetical protein
MSLGLGLASAVGCGGSTTDVGNAEGGTPEASKDSTSPDGSGFDGFTPTDGGQGDTSPDGAGSETGPNFDAAADGTGSPTIGCPTAPCGAGLGCCAQLTGDAGFQCEPTCVNALDCLKNSDCRGSTPICCATAVVDDPSGEVPACIEDGVASVTTTCSASSGCASSITLTPNSVACNTTDVVRGCTKPTDCNDPGYSECCAITLAGATLQGCVSDEISPLLTCM